MDGAEIETLLVDLTDASLDEVRRHLDAIQGSLDLLYSQVERPRFNIGNSGPPGRAD